MSRAVPWLTLLALVVVATGARFGNAFVFDDEHVIESGTVIHDPSLLPEVWTRHTMFASESDQGGAQSVDTYRPVPITLFMLDAAIWGRAPVGYHLTNLLLHLLVTLLVFALATRWLGPGARAAALYGAAVFAVHPWGAEAHVWINGRSDPLCAAFGLGAMLLWLDAERVEGAWRRPLGAALFLLGLLSKETLLLVAPAVLLMPGPLGHCPPLWRRARTRMPWVAAPVAVYLTARALVLEGMRTHSDAAMLWDAARNLPWLLADSLGRALVPGLPYLRSLRDEYAALEAWQIGVASLALVGLAVLGARFMRRTPLASWAMLWFFPPLFPIAILTTVLWPGFGRYLYVPLAGLSWALAELAARWLARAGERRRVALGLLALHVGMCAAGAASYTLDFRDSERLYASAVDARPDVAMGHGWLGLARLRGGDAAGAVAPLARAASLDPETHRYLVHEARARLMSGDRVGAAAVCARGIERFSGRPEEASYRILAVNSMRTRDPERALTHLLRCLEVWPGREDCAAALAFLLRRDPDAPENRARLDALLREHPEWRAAVPR